MSADFGRSADFEHRAAFPERRCVVANAECSGNVLVAWGGAQVCAGHWMKFSDADAAGTVERLRAWVREQRKGGTT